jgi:hypothetical protein
MKIFFWQGSQIHGFIMFLLTINYHKVCVFSKYVCTMHFFVNCLDMSVVGSQEMTMNIPWMVAKSCSSWHPRYVVPLFSMFHRNPNSCQLVEKLKKTRHVISIAATGPAPQLCLLLIPSDKLT